jgi:hypothetical protein
MTALADVLGGSRADLSSGNGSIRALVRYFGIQILIPPWNQ